LFPSQLIRLSFSHFFRALFSHFFFRTFWHLHITGESEYRFDSGLISIFVGAVGCVSGPVTTSKCKTCARVNVVWFSPWKMGFCLILRPKSVTLNITKTQSGFTGFVWLNPTKRRTPAWVFLHWVIRVSVLRILLCTSVVDELSLCPSWLQEVFALPVKDYSSFLGSHHASEQRWSWAWHAYALPSLYYFLQECGIVEWICHRRMNMSSSNEYVIVE